MRQPVELLPLQRVSQPIAIDPIEPELTPWERSESSKVRTYIFYGVNATYSVLVSFLIAGLAFNRACDENNQNCNVPLGIFYAVCSFVMNAPMAWLFTAKVIVAGSRVYGDLKAMQFGFPIAALFGTGLAGGTAAAGLKVAKDSVKAFPFLASSKVATYFFTALSTFNTLSTRLIGAAYLMYMVGQSVYGLIQPYWRPEQTHYYDFLRDLETYGKDLDLELDIAGEDQVQRLASYANHFYAGLKQKGLRPGRSPLHLLKRVATILVSLAIVMAFTINLQPLWIKLTVNGAKTFSEDWANSPFGVLFAALSNELFYINSSYHYLPALIAGFYQAKEAWVARSEEASIQKKALAGLGVAVGLAAWGVAAYFSGEAYGNEARAAMTGGFGEMADKLWFDWPLVGDYTRLFLKHYDTFATISAGLIVNGKAFLDWFMANVPVAQPPKNSEEGVYDHKQATEDLKQQIEKNGFEALQQSGLGDIVSSFRRNPHSLWEACKSCRGQQMQSDENTHLLSV